MCNQVLVVDDDRETLNLLGVIARTVGASVCLAGSGEEALAMLQSGRYRKLITDYVMPGMDGFTLAWLAKEQFPELEVVMMTGSLTDNLHQCAAAVGISRIVTKPLNSAIFLELL
jgi:CheY-like chemotaxis protein